MIAQITAHIGQIFDQTVILNVHGIGLEVFVGSAPVFKPGELTTVYIYMHWHQDNGPQLFGFRTNDEKTVFVEIIKCQGIGPKLALSLITQLGTGYLLQAIQNADLATLSSISGVGKKKAEQIVVQLKDKIPDLINKGIGIEHAGLVHWKELHDALTGLNYSRGEIQESLDYVRGNLQGAESFDLLMRKALSFLAKRKSA